MLNPIDSREVHDVIVPAIDSGEARRLEGGRYLDEEYAVDFFELGGRLIRRCYHRRTTRTTYHHDD